MSKTQFQIDMEKCTTEAQREALRAKQQAIMEAQLNEEYEDSLENDVQVDMDSGVSFR